ncbi:MAG: hypothetical protein H6703_16335 [Myxococcales bacterium]|nr:hypothetical protein [Myxococcales bacterium]
MLRWLGIILVATLAIACDDAGETDDDGALPDVPVREPDDAGPDLGPREDGGPVEDADVVPDMAADMGLIREIEGCADICAVYESCDRLDLWAGDIEECNRGCADAELSDRFQGWLTCLQITACGALEECVVPPRPRPSCADVCDTLEGCGASARIPQGLPGIANCAAACNDRLLEQTIVNCGEAAVYEPEQCTEEVFARCYLNERQRDCLELCDRRAGCEAGVDVIDCAVACAQPPAVDDPVANRRRGIARTCAREARDCAELEACSRQTARPIVGDATVDELCAANEGCGFLDGPSCVEASPALLRRLADGAIDCLTEVFTDACAEGPLGCFAPGTFALAACDEYCANAALCGTLPDGQIELECTQQCRAAVDSGEGALIAPLRPRLACAYGDTCADIAACEAGAGAAADCAAFCARRGECAVDGGADCVADCTARGATARGFAERTRTLAAAECDGAALCVAPPPPDCATLCAPLDACALGGADCVRRCDDADFADPTGFLPTLACVSATERCDARARCLDGDLAGGAACLAWCRRANDCQGGGGDPVDCVVECGGGLAGADGLTFDGARDCLAAAGADAECAALDACVDAVPADGYCAAFCGAVDGCRLGEGEDACLAACRAAPADAERVEQAACVLNARRSGAGCAVVAECIGAVVEPASPACQALCAAQNTCDEDVDAFLCERDCIPEPEGTPLRAACAARGGCAELPICLAAPAELPPACDDVCATLAMCPGAIGAGADARYPDAAACLADCGGAAVLSEADDYAGELATCLDAAACDADAVTACYEAGPRGGCAEAWAAFVACNNQWIPGLGGANDEATYVAQCEATLAADPNAQMQIDCLIDTAANAMADPLACFGQIACLLGGP